MKMNVYAIRHKATKKLVVEGRVSGENYLMLDPKDELEALPKLFWTRDDAFWHSKEVYLNWDAVYKDDKCLPSADFEIADVTLEGQD